MWHVIGHNAVHFLLTLHIADKGLQRFLHQPFALPFLTQRIAEETGMEGTAQHITEIRHAHHTIFVRIEQDKIISTALFLHLGD
ncbi:hypothetical protein D3C80_1853650 [compost metagenome]